MTAGDHASRPAPHTAFAPTRAARTGHARARPRPSATGSG